MEPEADDQKDVDRKAVAKLKLHKFRDEEDQYFYLYKGTNKVGRNPECDVWLKDDFVSREHLEIDIEEDGTAMAMVTTVTQHLRPCYVGTKTMKPGCYYEFTGKRKLKVAGSRVCELMKLGATDIDPPLKGEKSAEALEAIEKGSCRKPTFVEESKSGGKQQSSQPNSRQDRHQELPTHQVVPSGTLGFDQPGPYDSHISLASTVPLEDLTMSVVDENEVHRAEILKHRGKPFKIKSGAVLPPTVTLPCRFAEEPVRDLILHPTLDFNANYGPDRNHPIGATQNTDPNDIHNMPTQRYDQYDFSQLGIPSDVLPNTQSTQKLTPTSQDIFQASLPDEIGAGAETQPAEERQEGTDNLARISRSESLDPESPGASQQEVIPSTPVEELIGRSRRVVEDHEEQEKSGPEFHDEEDRVPLTPDVKQHRHHDHQQTAMSDVSTLETNQLSAPIPDSQATQEAVALSDDFQRDFDEEELVKREEATEELGVGVVRDVDSDDGSLSSPGDDDDEDTKEEPEQKQLERLGEEVCPDSQRTTQDSARTRSREGTPKHGEDDEVTVQCPPESIVGSQHSSQDSDRTTSREGSPKHPLETDPVEEGPPKPTKASRTESTDDVSTATRTARSKKSRMQIKTESADPIATRQSTPALRSLRSSTVDTSPSVMLSCSSETDKDKLRTMLQNALKNKKADFHDKPDKDATILVFESRNSKRTVKFMCAIARGIPIVTLEWLKQSSASKCCLPPDDFLFRDAHMEEEYHFDLEKSCAMGKSHAENGVHLFSEYEFYFVTTTKKNKGKGSALTTQYVEKSLEPLIKICGGRRMPKTKEPDVAKIESTIIIGQSDVDCPVTQRFIQEGFKVMDQEFLFACILQQQTDLDFVTHAIPARTLATIEDEDAELSDSTTPSTSHSVRSRSASVAPPLTRKPSKVKPQRSSSTISATSCTKKKGTRKK
ncbi:Mediator of DNA damage checkpoint protein 1 [Mortierella sp. GBA35]|nr:Mediator of DNA damage checkpoint protein 1 [Mortierella sp. GBA35]